MSAIMPEPAAPAPAVPRNKADLRLGPPPKRPRRLHLELTAWDTLYVYLYSKSHVHLSGATARFTDCYLDTSQPNCPFLCVGAAVFPLSDNEVVQIRAAFEPHGLRIRETDS
jgi:hypothetical protein